MLLYKVREELLKGKTISQLPLRVTFYARVSTETDEQLNSLDNQISFFKDYIKSNKNWVYVTGYIDEGLSGSSVTKRKNFLKMITDSKNNMFDLIVTKEVSRFSRNLADSIKYTQELLNNNVGVYFQANGINTYDPNSEFILNMMGSVAQEEVKRLSSRIKWGHREAIKKGRILGSSSITGYKKDNTRLIIVPEEKEKVEKIFTLYATEKYGLSKLALELHKQGINNSKGNIYDKDTLKRIIQNPKYKGFYCGHTTEVIDYKTKKRIQIPKKEQVIYKDKNIPPLVTEELWDKANEILTKRSLLMKENKGNAKKIMTKYCYSKKIFCSEHNTLYQRLSNKQNKSNPKWACSNYVKYRLAACRSPIIAEKDLNNIFITIMNSIFLNKTQVLKELLNYYNSIKINNNYQKEINILQNNIKNINNKKETILELYIEKNISNKEFKERNNAYNKEINILNTKLDKITKSLATSTNKNIEKYLIDELNYKNDISEFVNTFLSKMIISKKDNDRNNLLLDIYLQKIEVLSKLSNNLLFTKKILSIDSKKTSIKKNIFEVNVYIEQDKL